MTAVQRSKKKQYFSAFNVAICLFLVTMASLDKVWSFFDTGGSSQGDLLLMPKTSSGGTRGRNLMFNSKNTDSSTVGQTSRIIASDSEYGEIIVDEDFPEPGSVDGVDIDRSSIEDADKSEDVAALEDTASKGDNKENADQEPIPKSDSKYANDAADEENTVQTKQVDHSDEAATIPPRNGIGSSHSASRLDSVKENEEERKQLNNYALQSESQSKGEHAVDQVDMSQHESMEDKKEERLQQDKYEAVQSEAQSEGENDVDQVYTSRHEAAEEEKKEGQQTDKDDAFQSEAQSEGEHAVDQVDALPQAPPTDSEAEDEIQITSSSMLPVSFTTKDRVYDTDEVDTSPQALPTDSQDEGKIEIAPASKVSSNFTKKDRVITFVHVGKAGGSTVRNNLAPKECKDMHTEAWNNPQTKRGIWLKKRCGKFEEIGQKLLLQTRNVFHLWGYNKTAVEESTSFIVALRNPVDRIVSTYKYSHPKNCQEKKWLDKIPESWGCVVKRKFMAEGYGKKVGRCFPNPAMENFAQSVMAPWRPNEDFEGMTEEEQKECRKVARNLVTGQPNDSIMPHAHHNYRYYSKWTVWKYPQKEVFAIRTEHEWADMIALDKFIGGSGNYVQPGKSESHGSEKYAPSPLSEEAYQKLCCALESEIEIYLSLLDKALNLDAAAMKESEDKLKQKCGIETSWSSWRAKCKQDLKIGWETDKAGMTTISKS